MLYQDHNSIGKEYFERIRYNDFSFESHMHRHPELVYVREGTLTVITQTGTETIEKGGFGLILPHIIHAYSSSLGSVVDVCIFSLDYIPMFSKEIRSRYADKVGFICSKEISTFADAMLFSFEGKPEEYILKSVLYAICYCYKKQITLSRGGAESDVLMSKIIDYIEHNFTENITLKEMAKKLGYEEHYLSRCFHSMIPMHFSKYVNWYRVSAASELLRNSDLSMAEIALKSGFQSIRSFNRVFLEFTGTTPSKSVRTEINPTGKILSQPPAKPEA